MKPKLNSIYKREKYGVDFTFMNGKYCRMDGTPCCNEKKAGEWLVCTRAQGHKGHHRADDAKSSKAVWGPAVKKGTGV